MGIYQVTHKAIWLGQQIRNTFYYNTDVGEPSDSEWQDIADEIRADFVAELAAVINENYSLYGIDRRFVGQAGFLTFSEVFTSSTIEGSLATDSVPTQVALLVSNKGTTVKPNRARTYLAGLTEAAVTNSLWDSAELVAAEAFIDLQSNLNSGGTNPLSRVAAQWNTNHTVVTAINDIQTAASVGSQVPAT